MKSFLKKALPWFVCVLLFVYLFYQVPPSELWQATQLADFSWLIFYSLLYFFLNLIMDVAAVQHFLSRFASPITLKESTLVRGVSYLIMVINYHAAQGAFAIYFKKTHNAPLSKTLGSLAFISVIDLVLVLTSGMVAAYFSGPNDLPPPLRHTLISFIPVLYIGLLLWILFWKNTTRSWLDKIRKFKAIDWVLNHDVFFIFREAKPKDYLIAFLYRIPLIILVIGGYNWAVMSFHGFINWVDIFLFNPLIMLVSTLPITPAGLGTGQVLILEFFKTRLHSPLIEAGTIDAETLLLASSLLWILFNQIIKALFGALCLSRTSRELFEE
ncbi:MAG: flippase-like domain-containing protein [Deltaproteobacteria bacterium]|nr:flippase-like domain-containing protein [Deltaproteobacteria bacterium]